MTALDEMQFEILAGTYDADGFVFGIGADVSIDDGGFAPPDDDWIDEDSENPQLGGTAFGRDTLSGPTWAWSLHTDGEDVATAIAAKDGLKKFWRAQAIRDTPGAVIPIRYKLNGRVRRFYGRPRRWSAPPSNLILGGYIPITVDFKAADSYTYDDIEQSVFIGLTTGSSGGFVFPLTFPYTSLPVGTGGDVAIVGGDARTYPVIRIDGPVTNPEVSCNAWTLNLDRTIADGDYVEIDTRPWAQTVLLNGTSSVAGDLRRRQPLSKMYLEPDAHTFQFRGSSAFTTATCTVRWANAYSSY